MSAWAWASSVSMSRNDARSMACGRKVSSNALSIMAARSLNFSLMSPPPLIDDIAYMAVADTELLTNRRCRQFGRLAKMSNCAHIIPSESCSRILGSAAINEPPFVHHIGCVVGGRPNEEGSWIDTTGAITMRQYPH